MKENQSNAVLEISKKAMEEKSNCNNESLCAEAYRKRGCIKLGEFFGHGLTEDGDLMANIELPTLLEGVIEIPSRPCHNSLKWMSQPSKLFIYETPQDYKEDGYCLLENKPLTEDEVLDRVLALNSDIECALFVNRSIKDVNLHSWIMADSALQFLGIYQLDRKESIKQRHSVWILKSNVLSLTKELS